MRDLHVHVSTVTFEKFAKGNNQQARAAAAAAAAAAVEVVVVLFSFTTLYAQPNRKMSVLSIKRQNSTMIMEGATSN